MKVGSSEERNAERWEYVHLSGLPRHHKNKIFVSIKFIFNRSYQKMQLKF